MTKKDIQNKLDAYPDDWPLAFIVLEPADIYDIVCEMDIEISGKTIEKILHKISKLDLITGINRSVIETIILSMDNEREELFNEF